MRYAAHVAIVGLVVIALSFLCNGLSILTWQLAPETFSSIGLGSLPFYGAWIAICALTTIAYPVEVATPWRIGEWSRSKSLVLAGVIAVSIYMYMPAIWLALTGYAYVPAPLLVIAGGGIVGPFLEEWLFRGIVWNVLRRAAPGRVGLVTAIIGGALMFGFWHLPFDGVSWFGVQLAFMHAAFGIVMGIARWRLDSVLPGAILHLIGNSLFVITH